MTAAFHTADALGGACGQEYEIRMVTILYDFPADQQWTVTTCTSTEEACSHANISDQDR